MQIVFLTDVASDAMDVESIESARLDNADPDQRLSDEITDKIIVHESEMYDTEKDGEDRRNEQSFKPASNRVIDDGDVEMEELH